MKQYTRRILAALAAFWLLLSPGVPALATQPAQNSQPAAEVLLVCRTEDETDTLGALIRACGLRMDTVLSINYVDGQAATYPFLVTTSKAPMPDADAYDIKTLCVGNAFDSTEDIAFRDVTNVSLAVAYDRYTQPPSLAQEARLITYSTGASLGTVEMTLSDPTPFAALFARRAYVPYYMHGDVSILALGAVIQRFFETEPEGDMYIMIDEVYPFSDLGALGETAQYLHENAVPYIVRIMPVYDNLDYPAFSRYAQVLRYVQSHNGSIVLHTPLEDPSQGIVEPIERRMARFEEALDRQGVLYYDWEIDPFPLDLQVMQSIRVGGFGFGVLPFDTVIQFPLAHDPADTAYSLARVSENWLTLADYRRRFTEDDIAYAEAPLDESYAYTVETEGSLAGVFNVANQTLLWLVGISLVLFAIILLISRRIYRGKFF